jgi:uncharacterized protein YbjT (DUF2867 family)
VRAGALWPTLVAGWLCLLLAQTGYAGGLPARDGAGLQGQSPLVLVAGASGQTGRHVVSQLLAQGYEVRALTTSAFGARERTGLDLDWLEVDVRDPQAVAEVMDGVHYVICAIGSREWRGENSPRFVDYGGVRNLVDAAVASQVRHFVLISSAAAGPHRDHRENPRLGYVLFWKTKGEAHLRASGIDYTIIGPGGLVDGESGRSGIRVSTREDYRRALIARADVARLSIASLTEPAARNKSFAAVNDDRLGPDEWVVQLRGLPKD